MDNTYQDRVIDLVDSAAEALFRTVADIADPIEKARTALEVVSQVQDRLLPDVANTRRAAMKDARNRMSAQELAERLGISRARVYAVLSGEDMAKGPYTIKYATASGGVAEARVSWLIDQLEDGVVRVTRREIRRRWNDLQTAVIPEATVTANNAYDGFRSLENQAAYSLSKADAAFQRWLDEKNTSLANGDGWYFRPDGANSPAWPRTEHVGRL